MATTRQSSRQSETDHGIPLLVVLWFGQFLLQVGGQETTLAHENDETKTLRLCGRLNDETFTSVEVTKNLKNIAFDLGNWNFSKHFQQFNQHIQQQMQIQQRLDQQLQQLKEELSNLLRAKQFQNNTEDSVSEQSYFGQSRPHDCADIMAAGANTSGVYTVFIGRAEKFIRPVSVYCDMTTDGGGWTVFQRRKDGSEDFYRSWIQYDDGFGNLNGEFWLGNDYLYSLTRKKHYKLRVDLADFNNTKRFALFSYFKIGSECDKYPLVSIGTYRGTAGDSLSSHVGQKFTTFDQDNDQSNITNCAMDYKGAWWYNRCHASNLNGHYYFGTEVQHTYGDGVIWYSWTSNRYPLKFSEMKIKP